MKIQERARYLRETRPQTWKRDDHIAITLIVFVVLIVGLVSLLEWLI